MPEKHPPQETLAFSSPEKAREFSKRIEQRENRERHPEINRQREIIASELADEFTREGEAVTIMKTPWEHTKEEHQQAQRLVATALEKDLKSAIQEAKEQHEYPRNIDLFHDFLTTSLYKKIHSSGITRESPAPWLLIVVCIVIITILLSIVIVLLLPS